MADILNISAYKFVGLPDAEALRSVLFDRAEALQLKGTVLLAEEGINLFLAGPGAAVRTWVAALHEDERFADIAPKESWSDAVPFKKLLVKVKPEIIRMNQPAVQPQQGRAPAVDAQTLARWLDAGRDDEGREVVMLDTRNAFEVDAGRFAGAIDWRLAQFSQFPDALAAHREALVGKTVVSYCTGGIRCEKAALWMREHGVADVLQLEGGILKYFETVGSRHFDGTCFVFDERVALDGALRPADAGNEPAEPRYSGA